MHILRLIVATDTADEEQHRAWLLSEFEVQIDLTAVRQLEKLTFVVCDDVPVRVHVDLLDACQDRLSMAVHSLRVCKD